MHSIITITTCSQSLTYQAARHSIYSSRCKSMNACSNRHNSSSWLPNILSPYQHCCSSRDISRNSSSCMGRMSHHHHGRRGNNRWRPTRRIKSCSLRRSCSCSSSQHSSQSAVGLRSYSTLESSSCGSHSSGTAQHHHQQQQLRLGSL